MKGGHDLVHSTYVAEGMPIGGAVDTTSCQHSIANIVIFLLAFVYYSVQGNAIAYQTTPGCIQ